MPAERHAGGGFRSSLDAENRISSFIEQMYKKNDVVIIKSPAGVGIPYIHVRLIEYEEVKPTKGRTFDWPGYVGWKCELIKEAEAETLRKEWSIPLYWPDKVETFTFEKNIVKNVSTGSKKKKKSQ